MKKPEHNRPPKRALNSDVQNLDLNAMAQRARYSGSPYHKRNRWFGGEPGPHRAKAATTTLCPDSLHDQQEEIEKWLRIAIRSGAFGNLGELKTDLPKRVWFKNGDTVYEAMGDHNGDYHGYPLLKEEWPKGIDQITWNHED